ncbi:MAG: hypothetical protein M3R00_03515 [Pseudomonadota bacterium]|nr:hypothetical protein [Pseudomonadota bacterium]
MLTKDHWQTILTLKSMRDFRIDYPKQWDALKLVSKSFRDIIWQIEDNDKLLFYCDVQYPSSESDVLGEKLSIAFKEIAPRADVSLTVNSSANIFAVRQLGRQPTHHWAPLLVCDETFQLHLYEIHTKLKSPPAVCTYQKHTAKLTAAISLGDCIATADAEGCVGIWRPSKTKEATNITFFIAHAQAVTAIDYITRDVFVTGAGKEVKIWKLNQIAPIKTLDIDGDVKDIRARAIDELYILTIKNHQLKFKLYMDEESDFIDYDLDRENKIFICDELRIATTQKIIGVINSAYRRSSFQSIEHSYSAATETKKIASRVNRDAFFSRAGFCGAFTKYQNQESYDITINIEPARYSLMP